MICAGYRILFAVVAEAVSVTGCEQVCVHMLAMY